MTVSVRHENNPEVSVVMVTHGAWPLIESSVAKLVAHTRRRFELIVVDNASDGPTRSRLPELGGIRLVQNQSNRGFAAAVNQGAAQARGEYLTLLNSDAEVHQGWLDPLLEALEGPDTGAAVPMYLNPDGSLQEAGSLLAQDGSVLLYGEGDNPSRGCYTFARRLDYGSAACMAMRRRTFSSLGGLDEVFSPAYYEDADFCLRLASHGLAIRYEPRSTVTHARYGSGSREYATELSERNRTRFVERWGPHLAGRPASFAGASEQAVIAARDALTRPRLLLCGPDPARAATLLAMLLGRWPAARLTWLTGCPTSPADGSIWAARGVELIDDPDLSWLEIRLFHYDAVLCGGRLSGPLDEAVRETQPQASEIELDGWEKDPQVVLRRLAGAGIA